MTFSKVILSVFISMFIFACTNHGPHMKMQPNQNKSKPSGKAGARSGEAGVTSEDDGGGLMAVNEEEVFGLLKEKCATCHNPTAVSPAWLAYDDNNEAVDIDYDVVIEKLDSLKKKVVDDKTMPMGGSMEESERELIANWLEELKAG